jgi:hypothetical protein
MTARTKREAVELEKGFTCECGESHQFGLWVYAHWHEPVISPGPVRERLHLLQGKLAIFFAVHCLENFFVSRLKLLQ